MKKNLVLILSLFLVNVIFGVEASKKEKVVVLPFKDLSKQEDFKPGEKLSSTLAGDLAALGRFHVLDRTELESILEEQKLTLSGVVENDQGIKVGKLASAKMAFTGTVVSLNVYREEEVKEKEANLGIIKLKKEEKSYKKEWKAKLKVTIKVLNVESGEIIKSFTKETTYETKDIHSKEAAIDGAINEISDDIINGMRELFLIESYIIDKQGKTAIIRLGTNMGIKKGMEFYIYSDGNKIKDKYSGKILNVSGENIGLLYITDVDKDSAYAKIVRGKKQVEPGNKLREKMFMSMNFDLTLGVAPFEIDDIKVNKTYEYEYGFGTDVYFSIDLDQEEQEQAPYLNLNMGSAYRNMRPSIDLNWLINSPIYVGGINLNLDMAKEFFELIEFSTSLGIGGKIAGGKLGEISEESSGVGGAMDIILDTDSKLEDGASVNLFGGALNLKAGSKVAFNISKSSSVILEGGYNYSKINSWRVETKSEDGETVDLGDVSSDIGELNMTGVYYGAGLRFVF